MACIARGQILGDELPGETGGAIDDDIEFGRSIHDVLTQRS
jgi:hypothetical protein